MAGSLEQKHEEGKNIVWCATLQLAWDELTTSCSGPMLLEPARELAAALNRRVGVGEVDSASTVVVSAKGPDAAAQVRRALSDKFCDDAPQLSALEGADSLDWIVYAQLRKALRFSPAMDSLSGHFEGTSVSGFGVDNAPDSDARRELIERIVVCDDDGIDFVLEVLTDDPDEQLLIATVQPGADLAATVTHVVDRRHPMPDPPCVASLWVPKITLNERRDFDELVGCEVTNCLPEPVCLKQVTQVLEFGLDDRGVTLVAEAAMAPIPTGRPPPNAPRKYVVNGPFLVVLMRRQAAAPYFALWVNNPDYMKKK